KTKKRISETQSKSKLKQTPIKVSIIEASITIQDAIFGIKKTIEIVEPEGNRKASVKIPPGSRAGKLIRMRTSTGKTEELVILLRVAPHPMLDLEPKGLIVNIPISVEEATLGASIKVPGINEELLLTIPENSQSGDEIRIKNKGISLKDGTREDIFYRLQIKLPEFNHAVGLTDKIKELQAYYQDLPRKNLPQSITQF
ncbi:MAG: hypothetical protein KDD56_07700, partial [Bdellovibrionales bacterium]|nr:hypothetical protein [Bdellovibrionales bacterium]